MLVFGTNQTKMAAGRLLDNHAKKADHFVLPHHELIIVIIIKPSIKRVEEPKL